MDVCYILLGKSWQYEINVVHNGKHNIYTLSIKRKCIVLVIRREEETIEGKGKKKLLLSRFMNKEGKKREWRKEEWGRESE